MKRIRALGLGVVMALALTAVVGVGSATASGGLEADEYPVTLKGTATEAHSLTLSGTVFNCAEAKIEGTAQGPSGTIPVDLGPYKCGGSLPTETNGCQFQLQPGTDSSFDIGPLGCGPMIVRPSAACQIAFGPQTGLAATYSNTGKESSEKVLMNVAATGLKYTASSFCGIPAGTFENGTYQGAFELNGYNQAEEQVGVRTVDGFPVGIYLAGKASEEENQPRFEAEEYPATIEGEQDSSNKLQLQLMGWPLECSLVEMNTLMSMSDNQLLVDTAYAGCYHVSGSATLDMNSCDYAFNVADAGPPYIGDMEIVCSESEDAIEVDSKAYNGARISIPAQTVGEATYQVVGTSSDRQITVDMAGSAINFSWEIYGGLFKGMKGTNKDGSISGGLVMSGLR